MSEYEKLLKDLDDHGLHHADRLGHDAATAMRVEIAEGGDTEGGVLAWCAPNLGHWKPYRGTKFQPWEMER